MATPAAAPRPSVPAPRPSWLALARARHRSLLRRRTDRWRTVLAELLVLGLVVIAAPCALLGLAVYERGHADALQQARHLQPVQARIVDRPYAAGAAGELAQVRWTATDGTAHQAVAGVRPADQPGDQVEIWLDAVGKPVSAPASTQDNVGTGILTAMFAMLGADAVLIAGVAFARSRLDRRDERAWEAEWQVYEPLWSRRR